MDRGIYAATSGGLVDERRVDIVGHNLANANTVGFKAERLVGRQQEFADTLAQITAGPTARNVGDHDRTPGVVNIQTITDFTVGPMNPTGDPLNVALNEKDQFFVVQTPEGEAYTKAGNFTLNGQGNIVTPDGLPVLGDGGPITVTNSMVSIAGNGQVYAGGTLAGKLRVVTIPDTKQLERTEGTRFKLRQGGTAAQTVERPEVITGTLEMSNTGVVQSMVEMIAAQKSFESYAKSVQTLGELNDTSLRTARSVG